MHIKFRTNTISLKTEEKNNEKNYFVEGYISTSELDQGNDIVTEECLDDMVEQIKTGNIKIDVEHETWKKKDYSDIQVGKIIDGFRDETGIKVVVQLNKHHKRFKEIWGSLQDGFLDAFSIAFDVIDAEYEEIANA